MRENERVNLYNKNYLFHAKCTTPLLLTAVVISLSTMYYFSTINESQFMISAIISIIVLMVVQLIIRHTRIAALKGDTIILKGINAKSTVTSIKSIKRAKSFCFLGIHVTRVCYILDHQKKISLVFGSPPELNTPLDELIYHAKKCKK